MPQTHAEKTGIFTPVRDNRKFRTELHGVRGLAIALVVGFHVFGQGRVSGGIDVFLAITGFLAIPSLTRRAERGWHGWLIDVPARLAGLARRLIIPLAPVLLAVGIATWLILPLGRHAQTFTELRASALFYENWELINSQLDYGAAGPLASPLQHLWSTSIQGQFHLVMIAVVIAVSLIAKILRVPRRLALMTILAIITGASFAWAAHDTATNQAAAYFSTFSRAWQLTAPGILGLIVSSISIPPLVRDLMSWAGVGLIASCGAVMDGALWFPGPRALWPIAGICLVLAAGETRTAWGADRLLATRPFQRIGDISYSLYLWHWPILIFTMTALGRSQMTIPLALGILAASLAAGRVGYELFEQRAIRTRPLTRTYLPAMIGGAASLAIAVGAQGAQRYSTELLDRELEATLDKAASSLGDDRYPGSAVLLGTPEPAPAPILPADDIRELDVPWPYKVHDQGPKCVSRGENTEPMMCEREDLATGPLILMVGGSHVSHWADAFADLAADRGWHLVVMERSGCHFTTDARAERGGFDFGEECRVWNDKAMAKVLQLDPDLVIAQATTRLGGEEQPEILTAGTAEAITRLTDAGIPVMAMRETTTLERDMRHCDRADDDALRACTDERAAYYSPEYDDVSAEDLGFNKQLVTFFDSSRFLCTDTTCFAAIGNVRVHRDDNHLTTVLGHTIAPYIGIQLTEFRPELQ